MKKYIILSIIGSIVVLSFCENNIEHYISKMDDNHLSLKKIEKDIQKSEKELGLIGKLSDPMVSYGKFNNPVQTKVGPQKERIGITINIPSFSKTGLQRDLKYLEIEKKRLQYEKMRARLITDLERLFVEYTFLKEDKRITENKLELIKKAINDLEIKVSVSSGNLQEKLKLSNEYEEVRNKYSNYNNLERSVLAKIKYITGEFDGLKEFSINQIEFDTDDIDLENNPDILIAQKETNISEKMKNMYKAEKISDISLSYMKNITSSSGNAVPDDGEDSDIFSISMRLPLDNSKYNTIRDKDDVMYRQSIENKEDIRKKIESEFSASIEKYKILKSDYFLIKDKLLPNQKKILSLENEDYNTGKTSFEKKIRAEIMYENLKQRMLFIKKEIFLNKLELEFITGKKRF